MSRAVLTKHFLRACPVRVFRPAPRKFSVLPACRYDGLYKDLSATKLRKTWLQALAEREAGVNPTPTRDLTEKPAPKRMTESYHKIILPLSKDEWLVDSYVNASGQLRLGSLFQDLDALAGVVSYKHTGPDTANVTAAVDRISIINPLEEFCDLELSGFVSYVGSSSMEVSIEARKAGHLGDDGLLLTCAFTMVALNPATKKPTQVSPLIIETPEEKNIFRRGEAHKTAKKALAKASLTTQTPTPEESLLVHTTYLTNLQYTDPENPLPKPETTIYMSKTSISSTAIMQPQYRNRHSFMIFGGYLLKETMELAFCCCSAFAHSRPTFLSLDPSTFDAPVPVGSILYLKATVAYTEHWKNGSRVQVSVQSSVRDVEHGSLTETGVFNYTFFVERKLEVMPVTYSEFITFLDARRRAKQQAMVSDMDDGTASRVTE
ncbi:Thioesterase/thiol ester dehydrase-isomerase [Choiromyces venosus 120613-1]|uniref:Thioesterase/thiol ester dehydrase-isomerase n=1 Tax=Choiromyces venosus 120613-1 TaxID=1336337 RepID=A0A3N4JHY7_9PEZI|nr:Thioesterase/thiol ester dehydrase-isomerase [Choiromyces venosus 120613-1]